ncbi:hypothetical protein PUNSTDRAFT_144287 [Punctularia strigosozonata HHB-11173 SS5]|uniref:uncharacterized protein n=1 Tax=Punctularia strigosozonata (strain HHB-11173) TaxID=741275 RepID=UPI00044166B4|nr:uncharacterized protein PUNSTDRAFT_144287 [Punctularia strigosozonata HHB-11173 SS5]EIN07735.1 hypothetical protein PUNSTDRAFT_144287 [Punctularia strigosozonata HHB-11173 SS5]
MANPRQRRKARSSSHKPVSHSRRAKKLLKKQPAIRGPKVLQEAWDPRKTVKQNYAALGLMHSLNPVASGGMEVDGPVAGPSNSSGTAGTETEASTSTHSNSTTGLRPGFGRIVRDAAGRVVDVELGEEEEEVPAADGEKGDGSDAFTPLATVEIPQEGTAADWASVRTRGGGGGGATSGSGNEVVQALAQMTSEQRQAIRTSSSGEVGYLRRLVQAHGRNVAAMARDRRLNTDQRTEGQLQRAISRAGGFEALEEAQS